MKASRRARTHADLAADDTAVLQVLEAILAAMILLSAILFVTVSSSPVRQTGAAGINLGTLAEDTLTVLEKQPGRLDPSLTRLEEVVDLAVRGDTEDAERFLGAAVPQGTRYALRIDNGVEPLQLVPASGASFATPRAASGAATYMLSNWTTYSSPTVSVMPGGAFDFSNATTLNAPDGSDTGPGGEEWIDIWTGMVPDQDEVPASSLYGVWRCTGCDGVSEFRVILEDGTAVDRQLYAVQLLLWDGV